MVVEEKKIKVEDLPTRYLTAGEGSPLVLLHALGESALDWLWVLSGLAGNIVSTHRTYQASVTAPSPMRTTRRLSLNASSPGFSTLSKSGVPQ